MLTVSCVIVYRLTNCSMPKLSLLLSCEHASKAIPSRYASYFERAGKTLMTHRGYDIGAIAVYRAMKPLAGFALAAKYSRLLIDLNRSLKHQAVFSEFSKALLPEEKACIVEEIYQPYRDALISAITQHKHPLHIACHTFTPVLGGQVRHNDVGFLYDPRSPGEKAFCTRWRANLLALAPGLKVRMNYPYLGSSDGLPTHIRKSQSNPSYIGIELEVNQRHFSPDGLCQTEVVSLLKKSLSTTIKEYELWNV